MTCESEDIIWERVIEPKCKHYAALSIGEQRDADGNLVCLLGNCVKCKTTIALTGYVKIERRSGQEVYIKGNIE